MLTSLRQSLSFSLSFPEDLCSSSSYCSWCPTLWMNTQWVPDSFNLCSLLSSLHLCSYSKRVGAMHPLHKATHCHTQVVPGGDNQSSDRDALDPVFYLSLHRRQFWWSKQGFILRFVMCGPSLLEHFLQKKPLWPASTRARVKNFNNEQHILHLLSRQPEYFMTKWPSATVKDRS